MFALWLIRVAFADTGPSLDEQLASNGRVLERGLAMGAKRYAPLSDVTSPAGWERHYGKGLYQRFSTAKRRFDPRRILTPGPSMFE